MRRITYLGHSAFYIQKEYGGFLIDPFIKGNPKADFDYANKQINCIIVTHAHSDHLGDAVEISKAKNAPVIAVFELANYCISKGAKAIGVNIGGKLNFPWGSVKFVNAVHSSSNSELAYGGTAAGVILDIDGTVIYHAGDTALTADFYITGKFYQPYYSILPIGGFYTMDINDAAIAAKMLKSPEIIPMHYNTFPNIKADVQKFSDLLEKQGQKCTALGINEYADF